MLFPLAWGLSRLLHIDFEGKGNPLTKLGILFSLNQLLYILIVMWVYVAVPIVSLLIGLFFPPYVLCIVMVVTEALFSLCLHLECKKL